MAAITGGTGFLGRAVVARLRASGWRVRVLARRPAEDAMDLVPGSLEDEGALGRLVAGARLVVHAAGLTRARSAREFHAVNVEGAKRLGR
ncbi:MAG: NAD-dependent epimerase/dehydratase family protein, partial [Rhodospirillaceae bacterium]|nr:NAD-dependent epimerase/dehydratase family protein [Rhodospirillales bacterium]